MGDLHHGDPSPPPAPVVTPPAEQIDNPTHYNQGGIECIDAIEAALGRDGFIAFLRGQVIKYQWRLRDKGRAIDNARKAQWYGDRLTAFLSGEPSA